MTRRKSNSELRSPYRSVKLPDGTTRGEHRLVMESILGRRLDRLEVVHHKDGDKKNNEPSNLEVMTLAAHGRLHVDREAMRRRAIDAGCRPPTLRGEQSPRHVLTEEWVCDIKQLIRQGMTNVQLAELFGVHYTLIAKIRNNVNWKHVPWPEEAA